MKFDAKMFLTDVLAYCILGPLGMVVICAAWIGGVILLGLAAEQLIYLIIYLWYGVWI